ncbi:hypothetical protein B0H63DRAFT_475529 [Podospora didyma]|uniref:Uncharacterized protein n=1 Tax=Podospora didyma TaxID=330526 RepID=A0AAE0NGZ1_9PEZI|nr:hypothetical protein B0H63DRAFT_475529 [Podospora didyma]
MPQDPNLYGQCPAKKQRKEMTLPGSLSFTSQLSSLMAVQNAATSTSTSTAIPGRSRPSKNKTDHLFSGVKKRSSSSNNNSNKTTDNDTNKNKNMLQLKSPIGTEDSKAELALARRKMEYKTQLYESMKRGDYVGREIGLVDFDRKWAEKHSSSNGALNQEDAYSSSSSSSSSESDDNNDEEIIEYEDEFGRLRRGTRSQKLRFERRLARGLASTTELEHMSARPKEPERIILGDAVQVEAFQALDTDKMEELARKRDRSATPPPATHYQADQEIRTKGVGFYAFSKDEGLREAEMASLDGERDKTDKLREQRDEKAAARKREIEARRKEIEERRKEIAERKAKKMADKFLEGLGQDFYAAGTDGGGGNSDGGTGDGK